MQPNFFQSWYMQVDITGICWALPERCTATECLARQYITQITALQYAVVFTMATTRDSSHVKVDIAVRSLSAPNEPNPSPFSAPTQNFRYGDTNLG